MGIKNFFSRLIERNTTTIHPASNLLGFNIPRTKFDYKAEIGHGLESNVIMSPIQWVMRTFQESPVKLEKRDSDGEKVQIFEHPFLDLINNPNEFYTYETLIMSTMLSYSLCGNAYWLKVRNSMGGVIAVWYVPHWMIEPKGHETDTSVFIDHYQYNPNGQPICVPRENIVHFRFGLDPRNVRKGLSSMGAIMREAFTDDEASNYSASILKNMGVPGVVISPANEEVDLNTKGIQGIKEEFKQSFTGDKRGDVMVMTSPTKVDILGFDPSKIALPNIRNISEERVTAALGIPAAIVGFGTGLEKSTNNATIKTLKELAWEGNIIPSQKVISKAMEKQLLVDFDLDKTLSVGYDNSEVQALQEDRDAKVRRIIEGVKAGTFKVSHALQAEGLPFEESDEVYLRSFNTIAEA